MNFKKASEKYVAFLRGINVGGHHKIPMAGLRKELEELGFENIVTILNSGNVIFDSIPDKPENLETLISGSLEKSFGFPVPTIIRKSETIYQLYINAPFHDVKIDKDIRLYVSFLKKNTQSDKGPLLKSSDPSFKIIGKRDNSILSVLNLSFAKTPKAMEALEKFYGTDITTRNWNTIERIGKKLEVNT
jgi:uncharacterized protein (DUF1697 family)